MDFALSRKGAKGNETDIPNWTSYEPAPVAGLAHSAMLLVVWRLCLGHKPSLLVSCHVDLADFITLPVSTLTYSTNCAIVQRRRLVQPPNLRTKPAALLQSCGVLRISTSALLHFGTSALSDSRTCRDYCKIVAMKSLVS
jgi:hypothetical protein